MCKEGVTRPVRVKVPADLSCTGKERWKDAKIDVCIAELVEALQRSGIDMRGSCCGHGKAVGTILLQDGRILIITADDRFLADDRVMAKVNEAFGYDG